MSIHVAVEDQFDDGAEGMYACQKCGQPTWYDICDDCLAKPKCHHSLDRHGPNGCEARGCPG